MMRMIIAYIIIGSMTALIIKFLIRDFKEIQTRMKARENLEKFIKGEIENE